MTLLLISVGYIRGIPDYWIGLSVGVLAASALIISVAIISSSRKPRPNLRFRRSSFGPAIIGDTGYPSISIEIGNDLIEGHRPVGYAYQIRAHITYLDKDNNTLNIDCPGFWRSNERHVSIWQGESKYLVIAFAPDRENQWFTWIAHGKDLNSCKRIIIRLLDEKGKILSEIEVSFPVKEGKLPELLRNKVYRL